MKHLPISAVKILMVILMILIVFNLVIFAWLSSPLLAIRNVRVPGGLAAAASMPLETPTAQQSPTAPAQEATSTAAVILEQNVSAQNGLRDQGVLLLAMQDGLYTHLFAYHPLYLPLTRITSTPWDDITPALSPDGRRVAYSSRQNGYWDIYILDLVSGEQIRVTDTPEYEAAPTWSPDGLWLAYERYNGISLDIYIQALDDPSRQSIQLTDDPGIDRSPAWSPQGRAIAFVSTRTGDEDIWLALLDNASDRFSNLSRSPQSRESAPVWSRDGARLAWASNENGSRQFALWNSASPDAAAVRSVEGDLPAWSPDGSVLLSVIRDPQSSGLAAYIVQSGQLSIPYTPLPGSISGMVWINGPIVGWLARQIELADTTPSPVLWQAQVQPGALPGRGRLVALTDLQAPQPLLHDAVDEAFTALRARVAGETGWDTLASLENAYLPLTTPPNPSLAQDWLYTGRAVALNPVLLSSGWMVIAPDQYNGQMYWRVYLKARYQDGSMGKPLPEQIWDVNARFQGNPQTYENGGAPAPAPAGYWIDLTELARQYGWQRLPAWINWRTFFPSLRFNQLVIPGGLDWQQAMHEMYPVEALHTPTSMPTHTAEPSKTPATPRTQPTLTSTPTLTAIPNLRPTWTPLAP